MDLIINEKKNNYEISLLKDKKLIEYFIITKNDHLKEGDILIGTVSTVYNGLQSAFIDIGDEKNGYIYIKDLLPKIDQTKQDITKQDQSTLINKNINKILKKGDNIIVQIKKIASSTKGAKLSTHININGKYLVLLPYTDILTISKKITDKNDVDKLKKLVKSHLPENFGAIIRTKALGHENEMIEEISMLINKWEELNSKINKIENNDLSLEDNRKIYSENTIIEKLFLDYDYDEFENIYVCSKKMEKYINDKVDNQIEVIKKTSKELSEIFDLKKQIDQTSQKYVWLRSGGFIVIEKTEALTTIDVNSGKYIGNKSLEDTIFKINKEATKEIAKQLRLRDIGGIIIIDYIDMENDEDRQKILESLKEELKNDRSKYQVNGFTKLDLLEMTRKQMNF